MTQRIFDTDNKEDMDLLWSVLSERIVKIKRKNDILTDLIGLKSDDYNFDCMNCPAFSIRWHDKTEITRPVNYEDMIGCVGWFWDNNDEEKSLGVLTEYDPETGFPFVKGNNDNTYSNFRQAKKSELKFWGE